MLGFKISLRDGEITGNIKPVIHFHHGKKIFILIILSNILIGCCYNGKTSIYGLPRKKINPLKYADVYNIIIDTNVLYKAEIDFHYNTFSKKYNYYDRIDDNNYPYVSYHKFYGNGKLGLFIIMKKDTSNLKREFFDPKRAKMGYYTITGSVIKTRISTMGDCSLYISNKIGALKGDTLVLQDKLDHGTISIKKKVNYELLRDWQPDW